MSISLIDVSPVNRIVSHRIINGRLDIFWWPELSEKHGFSTDSTAQHPRRTVSTALAWISFLDRDNG